MPQQESLLREGIAALKAGNKRDGRQFLMTVVEQDPNSEEAWLWLAATAPTPRDSLACLKRVLAINPQNAKAAAGMRAVTAQLKQEQRASTVPPGAASKKRGFFPNLAVGILVLLLVLGLVIIAALVYIGWH